MSKFTREFIGTCEKLCAIAGSCRLMLSVSCVQEGFSVQTEICVLISNRTEVL